MSPGENEMGQVGADIGQIDIGQIVTSMGPIEAPIGSHRLKWAKLGLKRPSRSAIGLRLCSCGPSQSSNEPSCSSNRPSWSSKGQVGALMGQVEAQMGQVGAQMGLLVA